MSQRKIVTFKIEISPDSRGEPQAEIKVSGAGALKSSNAAAVSDITEQLGEALGGITERHKGTPIDAHRHVHRRADGRMEIHHNH